VFAQLVFEVLHALGLHQSAPDSDQIINLDAIARPVLQRRLDRPA
jgi:hypothetical protein